MKNYYSKTKNLFSRLKEFIIFFWPFVKKNKTVYNLKSIRIPRTSGRSLKILVTLIRLPLIRIFIIPILLHQAGLKSLRKFNVVDDPVMTPEHSPSVKIKPNVAQKSVDYFFENIDKKKQI